MESTAVQNNNYNPRVLEEHAVLSDYEQKKQRTMIVVICTVIVALLIVGYFIAKQKEKTPKGVLQRLQESSLPVTESASSIYAKGKLLGAQSAPVTITSEDRLQMLNSLNN